MLVRVDVSVRTPSSSISSSPVYADDGVGVDVWSWGWIETDDTKPSVLPMAIHVARDVVRRDRNSDGTPNPTRSIQDLSIVNISINHHMAMHGAHETRPQRTRSVNETCSTRTHEHNTTSYRRDASRVTTPDMF